MFKPFVVVVQRPLCLLSRKMLLGSVTRRQKIGDKASKNFEFYSLFSLKVENIFTVVVYLKDTAASFEKNMVGGG